jgi:RimJ/RimL family protein N-acetyltransferase
MRVPHTFDEETNAMTPPCPDVIETDRLRLTRLCRSHAPDIARLIAHEDITKWLTSVPWPYALADAERFTKQVEENQSDHFAIFANDDFAGVVSIADQLGYWLALPYHGMGYMTEAASALIDHHFAKPDLAVCKRPLISGYVLGNAPSARVLEKLGFAPTEMTESYVPTRAATVALQRVALDRQTWEAAR